MIRFDIEESKDARHLPPRTYDAKLIATVLKSRPIKIPYGFCDMCDSHIRNEWVLTHHRPYCELRHLVDSGILRESEMSILIENLAQGTLDDYWSNPSLISKPTFLQKLIYLFSLLKKFFFKIKIFFVKRKWYRSKKGNLYNPVIGATVYKYADNWKIAKDDIHYSGFSSEKEAQQHAFQMWLETKGYHDDTDHTNL